MENRLIQLERAAPADADALTAICTRSFEGYARLHGYGAEGCPPGYSSAAWHRKYITRAHYYAIWQDGALAGGILIFPSGGEAYEIAQLYVDPAYQGQGVGRQAMLAAEAAYPRAVHWTLNTPLWALSNQRFYEGLGYQKSGLIDLPGVDFPLVVYEKWIGRGQSG